MTEITVDRATPVRDWVRPDEGKVLGRVYVDPDVYAAEIERIWKREWLFAGHESEVPEPGDFVSRTVGTVPLIISRTSDGEVSVLVNRCAHRGNLVCNQECGNTSVFACAYHGWRYRNDGRLVAVPYQKGYDEDFDTSVHGLQAPARVSVYRGFVFVSHAPDGPDIQEHLGNAREFLDAFIDASPTGRLRLDAGYNRIRLDCNWKMYVENGSDNYHAMFVHQSAFSMSEQQRKITAAISADESLAVVRALGNGHSFLDFRDEQRARGLVMRGGLVDVDDEVERRYVADLEARLGPERAETILSEGPPTIYVFPNMFVIQQDIRRLEPVSPTSSRLYQHPALFEGAPEEINRQRLRRHEIAYGPAGFVMSDDIEIFARTQHAVGATPDEWILLARGLHREEHLDDGSIRSHVTDETAMRDMWRTYLELMSADGA